MSEENQFCVSLILVNVFFYVKGNFFSTVGVQNMHSSEMTTHVIVVHDTTKTKNIIFS